ncbi:hypothetical protein [Rheinheimera fenheensis]|uniref:hypothetical protein n=1 Tax=Rheinheimera fenheensis TaxID=3152295 RepID=UPI00325CF2D6
MPKRLTAALLCILIPLVDSLFLGNVFGLQWHSPALMYKASVYLVPVKLLFTIFGLVLLLQSPLAGAMRYAKVIVIALGVLHACMLALVCMLYLLRGDKSGFYRHNGNIQLYTADTGAMGKSYHYFSYLCRGKYGFYTLVPISREDWLGQFSFQQSGDQLVITQQHDGEPNTLSRPIPMGSCDQ